ncbi:MAG: NlpC/P60 family protein, partial [Solirubrobacteraceae bacterium]
RWQEGMSISAVVGRIDQILQLQQQVADPAAFAAGSSSSASSSSSGGAALSGSGTSASNFAAALASAQGTAGNSSSLAATDPSAAVAASALGNPSLASSGLASSGLASTGLGSSGLASSGLASSGLTASGLASGGLVPGALATSTGASATSASDPRVAAMVNEADSLIGKPYVWGGGHSGWGPQNGYDCSGFVSAVLHAGGYLSSPQDTQTLPSQAGMESGPGQYVTIYDRTDAGGSDHVIININGQFYESGGETGSWGGGGGVAKIGTPSAAYLATFNTVLHPAGL